MTREQEIREILVDEITATIWCDTTGAKTALTGLDRAAARIAALLEPGRGEIIRKALKEGGDDGR